MDSLIELMNPGERETSVITFEPCVVRKTNEPWEEAAKIYRVFLTSGALSERFAPVEVVVAGQFANCSM
jgi:hypothetical protein